MRPADTAAETVRILVNGYESGKWSRLEIEGWLIEAAGKFEPAALAAELPRDWLQHLQEKVASPPASIDEIFTIRERCYMKEPPALPDDSAGRQTYFDGTWAWHRYFSQLPVKKS